MILFSSLATSPAHFSVAVWANVPIELGNDMVINGRHTGVPSTPPIKTPFGHSPSRMLQSDTSFQSFNISVLCYSTDASRKQIVLKVTARLRFLALQHFQGERCVTLLQVVDLKLTVDCRQGAVAKAK